MKYEQDEKEYQQMITGSSKRIVVNSKAWNEDIREVRKDMNAMSDVANVLFSVGGVFTAAYVASVSFTHDVGLVRAPVRATLVLTLFSSDCCLHLRAGSWCSLPTSTCIPSMATLVLHMTRTLSVLLPLLASPSLLTERLLRRSRRPTRAKSIWRASRLRQRPSDPF